MRTTRLVLFAGMAFFLAAGPHAAQAEDGFFSKMLQQTTDLVSPSNSDDAMPRTAQGQAITLKDDAVAVDATYVATQVTIGDDDTVLLKSEGSTGLAVEPANEATAEPEKKSETPAAITPSMFEGVFDSLSFGEDAPAAPTEAK